MLQYDILFAYANGICDHNPRFMEKALPMKTAGPFRSYIYVYAEVRPHENALGMGKRLKIVSHPYKKDEKDLTSDAVRLQMFITWRSYASI